MSWEELNLPTITLWETIYKDDYCLSIDNGVCTHNTTIYSISETQLKSMFVESLAVVLMFWLAIWFLVMFLKWIIYLIMPNKWKKSIW